VLADLDAKGLLTSDHAFNHCNALPDKAWELIKGSGAAVNLAPRSDAAFGLGSGFPPIDQARRHVPAVRPPCAPSPLRMRRV
jgi:5-methylthioadenosine/S-adenosylhomocysteine deaminase